MGTATSTFPSDMNGPLFPPDGWSTDGAFDELHARSGESRDHWRHLIQGIDRMMPSEYQRRWEEARRQLQDNGVTYNVYGEGRGASRPWQLDPLPMVIPASEWGPLAEGLAQRARLLDLVLRDLYSEQKLLKENLLPPELVFANPSFLRPCFGMQTPGDAWLHLYACDLVRSPDGAWWVVADRTQAPSGSGYTLENRIVISRAYQELFRGHHVHRLASYFKTLRESLDALAPTHRDNPRVVLLTPGPYNETYFEHSYLSRYLGLTLVEGADLTVRDHAVYLKTLEGLQPVDVILRRLDDTYCDPLELRGDSLLGVPGLVQAAQAGNVAIANALGTGLVETPAMKPFLQGLCKHFLGEELKVPSVATWWCGQGEALKYVLSNLKDLIIKPAFLQMGQEPVFGDQLSAQSRDELTAAIKARPYNYVAQEVVNLSAAPVWTEGRVEPRHMALRSHMVSTGKGEYSVMPGGLTRVTASWDTLVVSMRQGGGSKDTWVLSDEPVVPTSLLPAPGESIQLRRAGRDLPSRVADNLYWLGRYAERAENVTRLLRAVLNRMIDENGYEQRPELPVLLGAVRGLLEGTPPTPYIATGEDTPPFDEYIQLAMFGDEGPKSLRGLLDALRQGAWMVRDRISVDSWRILHRLDREISLPSMADQASWSEWVSLLNQIIIHLAAFTGMAMDSMTRAHGWRFLEMGRRLERAGATTGLLRCAFVSPPEPEEFVLNGVLEVADSSMTYRSRYMNLLQATPVIDLLLVDESNPRSVAFQLASIVDHVDNLPRDEHQSTRSTEERLALEIQTRLRLAEIESLTLADADHRRSQLEAFLKEIADGLVSLSDAVTHTYFSHSRPLRQLTQTRIERLTTYASPDSL